MGISRVNYHSAAVAAIQITLRDYNDLLEYRKEYRLSGGAHRIDLLIIHKRSETPIPHPIAKQFSTWNIFEIKGISSSVSIDTYYKTIAYASLLIAEKPSVPPHFRRGISLSFVCHRYPQKLIRHLTKECKKSVENPSSGIYNINGDIFPVQILVTGRLSADVSLYLRCLTNDLKPEDPVDRLAADYTDHQSDPIYEDYMNQLIHANSAREGGPLMCCEGIFKLYGTSSKEIAEKAALEAVAPVMAKLNKTTEELTIAQKQNQYLRELLEQHGISYNIIAE